MTKRVSLEIGSRPCERNLVERLSLAEDRRHLDYQFTLADPEYLAAPISMRTTWDSRPDLKPSDDAARDPECARRLFTAE